MNQLIRSDILTNSQYLLERDERRNRVIALKKLRRVEVGDKLSFTFENRETMKYQIQEMMRVEHIEDEAKISNEIEVYNSLIPAPGSLSATMFIEVPDMTQIKAILDRFQGLDQAGTVVLKVGEEKSFADFEAGHSKEDRIAAVHYVKFALNEAAIRNFRSSNVQIEVRHPAYMTKAVFTPEQIDEIAKDLE